MSRPYDGEVSAPLALSFVKSASDHRQLGDSDAEIALIGRSNVGKSSLINALAQRTKLARTSKTPGATQLLNVYVLADPERAASRPDAAERQRWLVDLPGYGFAKLSKNRQTQMANMINAYLQERDQVDHAMVLIDANVGPTELDIQTIDWLRHIELPFHVVGTKVDKIKPSKRGKQQQTAAATIGLASGDVTWVSAAKGTGIGELRQVVHRLLTD